MGRNPEEPREEYQELHSIDQSNSTIAVAVVIAKSPEPADFAILVTQLGRPLPNETLHMDRANAQQRSKRYPVTKKDQA